MRPCVHVFNPMLEVLPIHILTYCVSFSWLRVCAQMAFILIRIAKKSDDWGGACPKWQRASVWRGQRPSTSRCASSGCTWTVVPASTTPCASIWLPRRTRSAWTTCPKRCAAAPRSPWTAHPCSPTCWASSWWWCWWRWGRRRPVDATGGAACGPRRPAGGGTRSAPPPPRTAPVEAATSPPPAAALSTPVCMRRRQTYLFCEHTFLF